MDQINAALENGEVTKAIALATEELKNSPRSVPILLARSAAFVRDQQADKALADAELAVTSSSSASTRANSQLRRLIALFKLRRYGEAKFLLRYCDKASDSKSLEMWQSILDQHAEPEEPIDEIPNCKVDTVSSVSELSETRQDWYQTESSVIVAVYHKGTPPDAKISIGDGKIEISHQNYQYKLDLWNTIDKGESSFKVTPNKIEFSLMKKPRVKWPGLRKNEHKENSGSSMELNSKWNNLKLSESDEESNATAAAASDPNDFFRKLYKDASPDVQRAMMKSFVESNGTALSTDWDEVKKGPVETHPPEDMVAKPW